MPQETIFISHASPEDNEFSVWLASRLEMLGYKVWIDKNSLLGGEKIWEDIDGIIRNETVKFILIYSKHIFQKNDTGSIIPGRLKDGVSKEYSFAENISKKNQLADFIIILNTDGSDFNLFIGSASTNQISFKENWATGFQLLVKKLEKDLVPSTLSPNGTAFGKWYEKHKLIAGDIIPKKESYYSNWWPIKKLPISFFIHQFNSEKEARLVFDNEKQWPLGKISNCISSFEENINLLVQYEGEAMEIAPISKYEIKLDQIHSNLPPLVFPTQKDSENHLKTLLKSVFHHLMKNRKIYWHSMANGVLSYYHTLNSLPSKKIKFKYPGENQRIKPIYRNLIGKYNYKYFWHYAISPKVILFPFIGYSLKNRLTFSDDSYKVWEDKAKISTHRRKKAKASRYYNKEWRDFLCAFLNSLCNSNGIVEIPLSKSFTLSLEPWPAIFNTEFGYYDPKDKARQDILNSGLEEQDEENEIDDEQRKSEEFN